MTTAQGAEYLGLSQRRLRKLVQDGAIQAKQEETPRGPVYWLQRSALDAYRRQVAETNEARRGKPGRPRKGAAIEAPKSELQ